jgi:hypothetical protein
MNLMRIGLNPNARCPVRIPIEIASTPTEFAPSLTPWIVNGKRRSKLQIDGFLIAVSAKNAIECLWRRSLDFISRLAIRLFEIETVLGYLSVGSRSLRRWTTRFP